jgi:hypothetical protein
MLLEWWACLARRVLLLGDAGLLAARLPAA